MMYGLQKIGFLVSATMMGLLTPAAGAASFAKTPQEDAMCQAMIYNGRDRSDRDNWQHMHHFCDCIRFTNRAYSVMGNRSEMRYNLGEAIGGCDYVLSATKPGFYMRPEVHLQKGKALRLYQQEGKAVAEFIKAIEGNPKLAQAYAELADIHARNKKPQEALKTVTEGLRHNAGNKSLQRRFTELGGKLPYPESVDKTMPAEVTRAEVKPETAPPSEETTSQAVEGANKVTAPTGPTPQIEPPKTGSPENPYCRFCP